MLKTELKKISGICSGIFFNWDIQEILEQNIEKLKARFPEGFDYKYVDRDMIK